LSRVTTDNADTLDADPRAAAAFAALDAELADAANVALRPIEDDGGPDVRYWNESLVDAWIGETWLDAPWLVSEFYFYRRVLEAIGYFGDGPGAGKDPFQRDKDAGLAACAEATKALAPKLNAFANGDGDDDAALATMRLFVLVSLWGNRMDLSIWPAAGATASGASGEAASSTRAAQAFEEALRAGEECLLWDDSAAAACAILEPGRDKIGMVVDNAGFELVCDLALADAIVIARDRQNERNDRNAPRAVVTLHVKAHPVFVSDAMSKDVRDTIDAMRASPDAATAATGKRWRGHVESGAWVIAPRFEWAQPQPFWELPRLARGALAEEHLVVIKGDANYRRLLGDRLWALDTPFGEVASYFPAPLLALRTLKAELGCGIPEAQARRAQATNPGTWQTDGKFGVVQYLPEPARQAHAANVAWRWDGAGSDARSRKELALVLVAIANACAALSARLAAAPLRASDSLGYAGDENRRNASGDAQKKLDVVANDFVRDALVECGAVRFYASEEEETIVELSSGGSFVVVCDPLDGSRNVDVGVPVGTIFGVYRVDETVFGEENHPEAQALRPGKELVAAGYANYSSSTGLVLAVAGGGAPTELDLTRGDANSHGEFREARALACPRRGQLYSLNDARFEDWPAGLRRYVEDVRAGRGATKKKYSARYVCSLVTDFHRTLFQGGWCGNPRPHLRLVYECAPLAFVARAAGGRGSDGLGEILDRTPRGTHERTPFFAGSVEDVDELESYGDVRQGAAEYAV
jgi:fructose-1,6-bisphosphatase I